MENWGVFLCLVWHIWNITTHTSWKHHKSSRPTGQRGSHGSRVQLMLKGSALVMITALSSESRAVGSGLSVQLRSRDGSIINTVWVKPMPFFPCNSQLSDWSRKDVGQHVGGEHALWVGEHGGWKTPTILFSLFSRLSIALSLLIRKLMQLSVLILESSFYSFFPPFFSTFFYSAQH